MPKVSKGLSEKLKYRIGNPNLDREVTFSNYNYSHKKRKDSLELSI